MRIDICFISFVFLCIFSLSFPSGVEGSISVIESGKTFYSKQDRNIGQQLLRGYEYMGRLQYVNENPTLCPGENPYEKFNIVSSSDGLPVALIAQSGGCSLLQKASVAARMINPENQVQYLIIQDSNKRHKTQLDEDFNEQKWSFIRNGRYGEFFFNGLFNRDDTFDENYVGGDKEDSYYVPVDSVDEKRQLEQFLEIDINLAVLHVSFNDGQTLLNIIDAEDPEVYKDGGIRLLLNSREWNVSTRAVIIWMLVTITICACFCCCILVFVQSSFEDDEPQQTPRRPARRRLTLEQVRNRFPAFHFNPIKHHQNCSAPKLNNTNDDSDTESQQNRFCQLSDECTICLDEFTPGVRCRQLPCEHVFHSTCIARWLIERSAVCPLCKLDLYEEEIVEEEVDNGASALESEPQSTSQSFFSLWSEYSRSRAQSSTNNSEIASQIEITSGNQQGTAGRTLIGAAENATTSDIARSWWPFSVEISVPDTEMEMHGDVDENDGSIRRSSLSSGFLGGWTMNLFGHIRRRHRQLATNGMLTELTEPLVSSLEQRVEGEHQQLGFSTVSEEEVNSAGRREEAIPPMNSTTSAEI